MNVLVVYPELYKSFWSLINPSKIVSEESIFPPKELIVISILLPITWERKIVDLNKEKLKDDDIVWADYIIISAKEEQHKSTIQTIEKCNSKGIKIIGSGSLFTEYSEEFENVEHLVLDDIRVSLPLLINDIEYENPQKIYRSNPFNEIRRFTGSYYSVSSVSGSFSRNIQLSHA